mgnify:FL=1|jgi:CBS domain-containing protein
MTTSDESAIDIAPLMLAVDTPMATVIATMAKTRSSCVLVLEQQQLVGIFTERDLVRAISRQEEIAHLTLADLMTENVICISDRVC